MFNKLILLISFAAMLPLGCDGVLSGGQSGPGNNRSVPTIQDSGMLDGSPVNTVVTDSSAVPPTPDSGTLAPPAADSGASPPPPADSGTPPPAPDSGAPPAPDAGTPLPPVGQLPTIVNLDWSAFPTDPGPGYPVTGKLWVVKSTGNDAAAGTASAPLRSIEKALSLAQSGDLIQVHGGSYAEGSSGYQALQINKSVVLTAAPGETVTVTAKSGYTYGLEINASDVVVNGINLSGFDYSMQVGGASAPQKNVVISNLTITAPTSGWTEGIIAYNDTRSKGFATSEGLLIHNVTLLNTTMGISCNAGPCNDWKLDNVKVVGQGGSGSGADAVAVEEGDNLLFYRVEVTQVAADGIDTKATRVVVWDCYVHDLERNGIKLWHGGDIVNTLVHHTGADAAIVTEQGSTLRLLHSTVVYHAKNQGSGYSMTFGYDSQSAQTVEIINSVIGNTNGGLYFNSKSTVKIENSVFFGIDNGMVLEQGSKLVYLSDGASKLTSLGLGSGNLFQDPALSSAYHLGAASPAIDLGKTLPAYYPAVDYAAKPRVKGKAPDPGPFEDF